jgi:thioester reductase-like protein
MTTRRRKAPLTLVTGFPQYTTRRLVAELAAADATARFALLVAERHVPAAKKLIAGLPGDRDRFRLIEGEVKRIDLGLSGAEFGDLLAEVSVVHHTAAVFHLGVARSVASEVNVRGTEEVLELCRSARELRHLVFHSTLGVSGDFAGVWTEDDYDRGQRFNNHYEETKFAAEGLVRREAGAAKLPVTILRAPVIVGDSVTGEVDRFDGPYQLMVLFVALPVDLGLPLPGRASRVINLIPVDFYARAARVLAARPGDAGRVVTFHIADPDPYPMARVFELVARASERKVPRGYVPPRLLRALMRTPGLERFAESPLAALDLFTADVSFSTARAAPLLEEAGVACPRFPDYVENLVAYLRQKIADEAARKSEEEVDDPLW